jgi:hypothetical protein
MNSSREGVIIQGPRKKDGTQPVQIANSIASASFDLFDRLTRRDVWAILRQGFGCPSFGIASSVLRGDVHFPGKGHASAIFASTRCTRAGSR